MNLQKMIVPIVMASDKNYLFPTCVTIISILKNGNTEIIYWLYLLVSPECKGMDDGLFEKIKEEYPNFQYRYLIVDKAIFQGAPITNYHITVETYYRLVISELLPEYDKCIYLDGDLIVECDASELYTMGLGSNYLAAVRDVGMQCGQGSYYTKHKKELGFDSMETYFNAGVLVFNLRQIREDNMVPKFLAEVQRGYSIEDQDVLNVTCLEKICYMPVKYNMFSGFLDKAEFYNCGIFTDDELNEIKNRKMGIVHYAGGRDKPWKNLKSRYAWRWWEYAKMLPDTDWAGDRSENIDWVTLLEKCRKYKSVILYGYTYISRNLLIELENSGVHNVKFFCDNNIDKVGQKFHGIVCIPLKSLLSVSTERFLIVNCAQKLHEEVKSQILDMSIEEENVVWYFQRSAEYYEALDPVYYDNEIEQVYEFIKSNNKYKFIDEGLICFKEKVADVRNYPIFSELYNKFFLNRWYVKMPLVSIVIPAYNAEEYIDKCLQSVIGQHYTEWECIVIDDGSKDATGRKIRTWCEKDRRFKFYSQENKGMGFARNRAISLAKGAYITFIDSDDWVEPDYVEIMIDKMLKNGADACKSNFFFHDMAKGVVYEAEIGEEIDVQDSITYKAPNMWCNMFSVKLFKDYNINMPEIPLEDLAVYPLLLLKANKVIGISKPIYHYQINTGKSVMDNIKNVKVYPAALDYLLNEAERLGLREKNAILLRNICSYHMLGALNSRVKNCCTINEFEKYQKEWIHFLNKNFPSCRTYLGTNRIWIWGSYNLSRIVANIPAIQKYQLAGKDLPYYFGFSSIIPLMMNKENIQVIPMDIDNVVRSNMLYKEANREFLHIQPAESDYFILDFLEERFDLFKTGETWLTRSDIWKEGGYAEEADKVIERQDKWCQTLWENACDKFIEMICSKFKIENIILVENYLATKCKNENDLWLLWDEINDINLILKKYYEYFKKRFPKLKVLKVPNMLNYTSAKSKYGKEPNYLNSDAHRSMAKQANQLMIEQSDFYSDIKVSVIIPTYNAGLEFQELLYKINKQKLISQVEIIVVDSGSTDKTLQIAKENSAKIIGITQEQFTHSYSRNLGAEHAHYDYIVFTVQDALPENDLWLIKMIKPLLENENIAATTCIEKPRGTADLFSRVAIEQQMKWLKANDQDRVLQMPVELKASDSYEIAIRRNACLNDVACAYKRDIFLKYKYRLNYAEDLDMGKRLIEDGYKLGLLGTTRVIHSHSRSGLYYLKRMIVERKTYSEIFSDYDELAVTEPEFITGTIQLYEKVTGWIDKVKRMSILFSRFAVLIDIKDMCSSEQPACTGIAASDVRDQDLEAVVYQIRDAYYMLDAEQRETSPKAWKLFYRLYMEKMNELIDYLWQFGDGKITHNDLREICIAMYCLLGNVIGTIWGDSVVVNGRMKHLQKLYETLCKGI